MNRYFFTKSRFGLKWFAVKPLQGAALALAIMLVLPAMAAEDRAVKSKVAPIYPEVAKRMRVSGAVDVEATVDPAGNVSEAKAVGGNRLLAPAAEDAVRKWKFESGSGTSKVKVEINFAMGQ
jgi:TonB family protein